MKLHKNQICDFCDFSCLAKYNNELKLDIKGHKIILKNNSYLFNYNESINIFSFE